MVILPTGIIGNRFFFFVIYNVCNINLYQESQIIFSAQYFLLGPFSTTMHILAAQCITIISHNYGSKIYKWISCLKINSITFRYCEVDFTDILLRFYRQRDLCGWAIIHTYFNLFKLYFDSYSRIYQVYQSAINTNVSK